MSDAWNPPESDGSLGWGAYDDGGPGEGGLPARRLFEPITLLKLGWAVLEEQPALVLVGGVCLFAVQMGPSLLGIPLDAATAALTDVAPGENPLAGLWGGILGLLAIPFQMLLSAGMFVGAAHWVTRDEEDLTVLFTSVGPAIRMLVASLIVGVVTLALMMLCLVPLVGALVLLQQGGTLSAVLLLAVCVPMALGTLWVVFGFSFVQVSAVLDGGGPMASVDASWRAARGTRLVLLVTYVVLGTLYTLGCCLAGLPFIVLSGMYYAGFAAAWLLHTRPAATTARWSFVQRNGFGELYRP